MYVYIARYHETFGWVSYYSCQYVVVAENEKAAIALAMEAEHPDAAVAECWSVELVEPVVATAIYINNDGD